MVSFETITKSNHKFMFQEYFNQIAIQYKSHSDSTEATYRTAFENLLNQFEHF